MAISKSYSEARAHFSELCDAAAEDREIIYITRRKHPSVAIIAADELESLLETAHLLRSPKNAARLLSALNDVRAGKLEPEPVEKLRAELGIDKEEA
ncbi:MAG: type II toxin-antitoxin system prevent-host-death family antitoxin [Armatimonadetes bacterium]|nr:type II toxin-antitoxin system prevent-host-death family antitoxin [Armatimonadota bacterium]